MTTIETIATRVPRTIHRPLRPSGLLACCSRRELAAVERRCDIVEVDAGTRIQDLQPLHWVYVVIDGALAVTNRDRFFVAGRDSAVGASAALASGTPIVAITALADSMLLVTTAGEFAALVGSVRGLAASVARYLAHGSISP